MAYATAAELIEMQSGMLSWVNPGNILHMQVPPRSALLGLIEKHCKLYDLGGLGKRVS